MGRRDRGNGKPGGAAVAHKQADQLVEPGVFHSFRKPYCGSVRIDETYIKVRGQWRYLYRAIAAATAYVSVRLTELLQRSLEPRRRSRRLRDHPPA